jgi:hypothetical protein
MLLASAGALTLPQNVWSQDFDVGAEIARIRKSIGVELGSPLARLGLLDFAGWFRIARINTKPLGYEAGEQYTAGSETALTALTNIIPTMNPEGILSSEPDSRFVGELSDAYKRNSPTNKVVFSAVRGYAQQLRSFSDDQFSHFQLMIALILRAGKQDVSEIASKITFFYPFC